MVRISRGEIVIADLEPVIGSEQGGTRPVLVIQNGVITANSPTTIVAPITSKIYTKEYPTNVELSSVSSRLKKDSTILLNQIRTIDKKRIVKRIIKLPSEIMKKVDSAIKVSLELD